MKTLIKKYLREIIQLLTNLDTDLHWKYFKYTYLWNHVNKQLKLIDKKVRGLEK